MDDSENIPEKISMKDFDEAYNALSHFLFEEYKKKKLLEATETQQKDALKEN